MNMAIHKLLLPSSGQSPERTTQPPTGGISGSIWTAPTNPTQFRSRRRPDEHARHSRAEPLLPALNNGARANERRSTARQGAAVLVRAGDSHYTSRHKGLRRSEQGV
ncbi:hypothetical protein BS78_01G455300 [Paspalum vaginatum]|nr:hypothetical protein BS78_01G455300 [Paspalum vaginatum]